MFSSHRQRLQLFFGSNKSFPRFTYFCSVRLVPLLVLLFASFQNFETGINASAQLFSSSNSEIACSPSIDMFASPISRSLNVLKLLCYRTTVLIISWSAIVPLQKSVTVFSACWAIVRSSSFLLWLKISNCLAFSSADNIFISKTRSYACLSFAHSCIPFLNLPRILTCFRRL